MRFSGFGIYRYTLPFTEPLTLKGVTLHSREGLLLRAIGDDGSEGWGEAAPLPGFSRESLDEAANQLIRAAGEISALGGRDLSGDRPAILRPPASPSVWFAVELALGDLDAARRGVTMLEMFDSGEVDRLTMSGLLSGPREKVIEGAARMREDSYRSVKLKVGGHPVEEDALTVREVCETLGEGVSLRLDANRAWSFDEAMGFARAARDVRIEYIEEPLSDAALLPRFADESGMPVALDESLVGMAPDDLEEHEYARAMVLKPTMLGGISHTLRMAAEARRLGMTPTVSSAYESGVGVRSLIALSAATGGAPAGLDTYRRLAGDVLVPPLDLDGPWIDVRALFRAGREMAWHLLETVAEL